MSITLDVNAFLNKDVCSQSACNGDRAENGAGNHENEILSMEKEMETTNIFEEIEHLLKFNKNLEYSNESNKEDQQKKIETKKADETKPTESFNLDFFPHSEDFLLASETQSLLGEDSLLFSVEHDRLQPLSSKFMVPGIYKRIEGVDAHERKRRQQQKLNVFITTLEKSGCIIRDKEFERLYDFDESGSHNPIRKVTESVNEIKHETKEKKERTFTPEDNVNKLEDSAPKELDESVGSVPREENANKSKEKDPKELDESVDNVPKELDNLHRLACDILKLAKRDHIVIDRNNNEIVRTHHRTNQKTIYRFCHPDMLDLKSLGSESKISTRNESATKDKKPVKLGRPRKRLKEDEDTSNNTKTSPKDETVVQQTENPQKPVDKLIPHSRTRSGRLVRIPSTRMETTLESHSTKNPTEESLPTLLNDLRDTSYHNSKVDASILKSPSKTLSTATESDSVIDNDNPSATPSPPPPKRKVPSEAICPTCHKIFLGKRLQRHFAQHPDHIKVPTVADNHQTSESNQITDAAQSSMKSSDPEDISLFRFLVNKLQRSQQLNEDQKADLFLAELNDLVEQLQLRSSRLIRNTSGLHFVNQKCSKLLGIPEGQYALDMTAIESHHPIESELLDNNNSHNHQTSTLSLPTNLNTRSLDYTNLSITLDDTLTDEAAQKLNLSAGGKLLPPSEESLLRAVDDLVQTDIRKIQTTAVCASDTSNTNTTTVVANLLPPHIDHVSDNAVEAVHMKETLPNVVDNTSANPLLDLQVDFFQFNN
ncbi:uncharacterized protein LOC133326206 [Musca vetustissima]|uniref:uncharacterized protein LOC133326206 n=1 Tax=Musca vetustissima TaxID=27455 RepID=UPI002AB61F6A|nr:uncharacterized protein LOC133326206 [Musca vetustissima]